MGDEEAVSGEEDVGDFDGGDLGKGVHGESGVLGSRTEGEVKGGEMESDEEDPRLGGSY